MSSHRDMPLRSGGAADIEQGPAREKQRSGGPGTTAAISRLGGPASGTSPEQLVTDAQLYLNACEVDALETLQGAAARGDRDAAGRAWARLSGYLAVAEQSLADAEALAERESAEVANIRDETRAARALAAEIRADGLALVRPIDPELARASTEGPSRAENNGAGPSSVPDPDPANNTALTPDVAMDQATQGSAAEVPHRAEMERALGASFGGVRAHVGQSGPLAAMNAEAAARGEEVAFASRSPDRAVVAHELAHVVQQRGSSGVATAALGAEPDDSPAEREARRVADAVVTGAPVPAIRESPRAGVARARPDELLRIPREMQPPAPQGATATAWLPELGSRVRLTVRHALAGAAPACGHPRLRWLEGRAAIALRVWNELAGDDSPQGRSRLAAQLPALLAPADVLGRIDEMRPIDPANSRDGIRRGPLDYVDEIGIHIAREVELAIAASLVRIGPRVVAAVDAMPDEAVCGPRETSVIVPEAVVASHPMDHRVAAAVCAPGVAEVAPKLEGEGDPLLDRVARMGPAGLRKVTYVWHEDAALWNWIRVDPPDAAAEEVAAAVLGDPARAFELKASAPFFALPPAVARRLTPARAERAGAHVLGRKGVFAAADALKIAAQGAGEETLAESMASDEAGLVQAERTPELAGTRSAAESPAHADPVNAAEPADRAASDPALLADRCHLQLRYLAEHFQAFGAPRLLAAASSRLERRRAKLDRVPPDERAHFARLFAEQGDILYEVAGELVLLEEKAVAGTAQAAIDPIFQRLAARLLDVAGLSDLPESARARLAAVREERATADLDALDAMVSDARAHSQAAAPLVMKHGPDYTARDNLDQATDLRQREQALAGDILAARRAHARGEERRDDRALLRERARAVQVESRLTTSITHCTFLVSRLRDQEGLVARMTLQQGDLVQARRRLDHLSRDMTDILLDWRGQHAALFASLDTGTCEVGDPAGAAREAIAQLERDLTGLGDAEVQAALQAANDELRDMAIARMVVDIAVMVGLTLVTSGLGTMASAAARSMQLGRTAAALADITTQSVAMAGLRTAIYQDSFGESIVTELATNFAGFAALRGVAHALPELQAGKRLAALKEAGAAWKYIAHATELTLEGAVQAGVQFALAQGESLLRKGRPLDREELKALAIQGMGMFIGNAVAHRLAQPAMAKLADVGARFGAPFRKTKVEKRAQEVFRTGQPDQTRELLREDRQLLEQELELYRRASTEPALLAALGGEGAVARLRGEAETHAGATRDLAVEHALRSRLDEDVPFRAFSGHPEAVQSALSDARAAGATVTERTAADGRTEYRIENGAHVYTVSDRQSSRPASHSGELDPLKRTAATREALTKVGKESHPGADPAAREQLAADIRRQNPDMALMEEASKGTVKTIVRLIISGTKPMNDKFLGRIITDRVAAARNDIVRRTFAERGMKVIETDYKEITITTTMEPQAVAGVMDEIVATIDRQMAPVLRTSVVEAVAHWRAELKTKKPTDESRKFYESARSLMDHPEDVPFGFQYGIAALQGGAHADFQGVLAAKMNATRGALMSRVEAAQARAQGGELPRGATYDDQKFVAFMAEGERIKHELVDQHRNTIKVGGRDLELFDHEGLPSLDALRLLRKGELDPKKLAPSERDTARKFQSYYDHVNALDYMKGFQVEDIAKAGERVQRALAVVKRLDEGGAVSEAQATDLLDRNASGRQMPKDKTPSERVFYDASLKLEDRFILNADIKDMGNNLAREYARKQAEVAQGGAAAIPTAALTAEDAIVRFKRDAAAKLGEVHERLVNAAIIEATKKGEHEIIAQLQAERERGLLFLFGGDEITVSLHPAMKDHVGELVAAMIDVANARVAVQRTGKGPQDGGVQTKGSLKHAMDADESHKILKRYEERQRELLRALNRIRDNGKQQEGSARIRGLGIDRLYVDAEFDGNNKKQVLRRAPEATPVPKDLDARIAEVLRWLEKSAQ